MHTIQDIDGVVIARGTASAETLSIILTAPSGFSDSGHYFPAESLTISGLPALAALHTLIGELIDEHMTLADDVDRV
jgi:hypothetical protein